MADESSSNDTVYTGSNVVSDDTITPQIAEARAKLQEMVGGDGSSKSKSPSGGRHVPSTAQRDAAARATREDDARRERVVKALTDARDRARAQQQQPKGEEQQQEDGGTPELSADAAEARRVQLTQELVGGKLTATERLARMTELAEIVNTKQATPEEAEARAQAPLSEHREFYGMAPPDLPPTVLQAYEANFSGWENDLLLDARRHGLAADVTRGLRDDGIALAMQIDGKPLDEAVLDKALAKYGDRLTSSQRANLKAYWRQIEGGAS
jgi:hypothetical protein